MEVTNEPRLVEKKANEILQTLSGLCQKEIEHVLSFVKNELETRLILQS